MNWENGIHTHILLASYIKQMINENLLYSSGFPYGKNLPAMQERPGFNPWVGKTVWRREQLPTQVIWPGEFHRQMSLAGYSPWDRKESDRTK